MLSIVGWFSRLPSPEFAADSVAPPACPLACAAERALFVGMREDAQNGSTHACAGYFLRYVAYFYRFYVLYAMYHPLLCLAEA